MENKSKSGFCGPCKNPAAAHRTYLIFALLYNMELMGEFLICWEKCEDNSQ